MNKESFYKGLFLVAGLYDVVLGTTFFLFYVRLYGYFGITLPNHPEYVHAPSLFIVILGVMFFYIYKNMYKNVDMVKIGILSKAAYSGLAFYHYVFTSLPVIFVVFAWFDLAFLILFVMFLRFAMVSGKA
jgi:hypothetical protein